MQNFTFGRKGTNWFLFAFVLLIGTLPSFGQEDCPTLGNANPEDLCYLDNINDLSEATEAPDEVVWYRDEQQTQPVPTNEFLENGLTYWAGNQDGDCVDPTAVEVTFEQEIEAPVSQYGNVYSPYLESADATRNINDLTQAIDSTQQGYEIVVYETEYGTESYEETDELTAGQSYFVGQTSSTSDCYSSRIAIRFSPDIAPAPSAESPQVLCEGATVADLEATGTSEDTQAFRWYSTNTSNPALEEDEELRSGTYYVSQIVNDEGLPFPPTESEDRFEVIVEITPSDLIEETQRFCESIGEGNNFRQPEVQDLRPAGEWFADATSTEPLDPNTELIDEEDYFNRDGDNECSQLRVTAEFFSTPNAGSTTQVSFCENEEPVNLVGKINDSQLGAPDQNGTFSPELENNIFDPSDFEPGSYNFTYIVEGNEDCPTDTSSITVTVQEGPNAGEDVDETVCSSELDNPIELIAEFSSLIEGRDEGGVFDDNNTNQTEEFTLSEIGAYLLNQFNDGETSFSVTYTVTDDETNCDDSAEVNLNILESPDAGDDGIIQLIEESDNTTSISEALEGNPTSGGTWTNENNEEVDASLVPQEPGVFTYTVTLGDCSESATVTVLAVIQECPEVTQTEQSFCESIGEGNNFRRPTVSDLIPATAVWYDSADSETALADDTILENGQTYFAGNPNGTCEDRDSVIVTLDDSPNAGATTSLEVCSTAEPFDILDELNESILGKADQGGTISPALASGTTIFDPSVDAARQYIYTVESSNQDCPDDEARITITIEEAVEADAGPNVQAEYCSNEGIVDLYSLIPEGTTTEGIFENYENGNFDTANNLNETEITYVVSSDSGCFDSIAEATYTITVNEAPDAGEDVNLKYCITEIEEMTELEVLEIFTSLLGDRDQNGTFPEGETPMDLYAEFSANPIGTFSTTYTVANEECTDTAELAITINDTEEADAGSDVENIIVCSTDGDINLFDYLSEDAAQEGYFEDLESGTFSPSTSGPGSFTFTFTVDSSSDCVTESDSAIYSVEVLQGPNAGENGSVEFTREDDPVNLFTYLNGTPDEDGTWTPGNNDGSFDPATDAAGTYTYTVTNDNDCDDLATVTVTFSDEPIEECPEITETEQSFCESIGEGNESRRPTVSDLLPTNAVWYTSADSETALADDTILEDGQTYFAGNINGTCEDRDFVTVTLDDSPNAGATTSLEVCRSDEAFDIVEVLNESILGEAEEGGTISPALASGTTIFDPSVDTAGQYTYTVSSANDACPDDEARITITFAEGADAGEDIGVNVCTNDDLQDLYSLISADVDMDGEFTLDGDVITDGIMDPSQFEVGTYEVIYTVTADENDECSGDDMSTITITLGEAPEAPTTGEAIAFCAIDGETATRLEADGTNLTWYSDADLTMMVSEEDLLVDGDYYVTQSSEEGCESEAAVLTVNIVDSPAPTISSDYELCEFDNPTTADLSAEINESGEITWYESADSMTALSNNATLTDGTTYYATLISDNGCESSERLAVTVTLEDCALLFPEAITPNGDGRNDRFVIENIEREYPNFNITIFNRWGNAIYKGNASTPTWDGTSNQSGSLGDDVLPVGVYFYVVDFNDGSTEPRQGKVYLNR